LELAPTNDGVHNHLAWLLTTCPDAKLRDPRRALQLAKKCVKLVPNVATYWTTLGIAYYRAGDWNAAVAALGMSNDLSGEKELGFNALFLAMTHWQLGNKEEACKWYDRAVQWTEKYKPGDEELRRFRAEAAELLGVGEKKD